MQKKAPLATHLAEEVRDSGDALLRRRNERVRFVARQLLTILRMLRVTDAQQPLLKLQSVLELYRKDKLHRARSWARARPARNARRDHRGRTKRDVRLHRNTRRRRRSKDG